MTIFLLRLFMINVMAGAGWLFYEEGCQGGIPFCGSEEVAGSDAEVTMNQHIFRG
jgi:hypothetical protein